MKQNPELAEELNAARHQAQIQPLLVILRESKRSWRAAAWVVRFLQAQVQTHEETPDEARARKIAEGAESRRLHKKIQEEEEQEREDKHRRKQLESYGIYERPRRRKQ
jgi:hypothetical protein